MRQRQDKHSNALLDFMKGNPSADAAKFTGESMAARKALAKASLINTF